MRDGMKRMWGLVLLVGLITGSVGDVRAQETQIPFDSEGSLMEIGPDLADSLELFTFIEGFQRARLFQHTDGAYTLEVTYVRDDEELIVRDAIAELAYEDLRRRVDEGLERLDRKHDR
jgi:hypothetical protein